MLKTDSTEVSRRTSAPLALLACGALLLVTQTPRAASAPTPQKKPSAQARPSQKAQGPSAANSRAAARVPEETLIQIVAAEDERRWDESDFGKLFADTNPAVRRRAALAAGRIGDEGAV